MPATDPIADFLTRIRNAVKAKKKFVDIPSSKMKVNMAEILRTHKFIRDYNVDKRSFFHCRIKKNKHTRAPYLCW